MSAMAVDGSGSDDEAIDITEYSGRGKKLKNSKSAWTTEVPKTMRQELEVAESEAAFYRGILDVIIAHLDPNIEGDDVERIVLPPRVPNDVRKKLRKYRVEAKNIIVFIDDKMGNESDDDDDGNKDDEKAEAVYITTLIEKLCSAVKEDRIPSKFKLPRVPVVDAERKDRLKGYRKDGGEIVECLKRLKSQKIERITQTDFPEEDMKIRQTQMTEYIVSGSTTKKSPESRKKKLAQRTRQTQTDFDEQKLGKASVINSNQRQDTLLPSYSTVLADYNVSEGGMAVLRPGQHQKHDFSKAVKSAQELEFFHQQAQYEQQSQQKQYQHFHDVGQQQQQLHGRSDDTFDNDHSRQSTGLQDKSNEWQHGKNNQWSPEKKSAKSDGSAPSSTVEDLTCGTENGSEISNDMMEYGGGLPQRSSHKSNEDYINMLEAYILKLSCRISLLETQLHDSQRTLVVSAYSNDAVLDRVKGHINTSNRELSDLEDKNRPTKLAERFQRVYQQEWIDIFQFETTAMNKSEEKAIADILEILQSIYNICIRVAAEQIDYWHTQIRTSRKSDLPEFLKRLRKLDGDDLLSSLKQTQTEMAEQLIPSIRQEVASNEVFTSFYGPELSTCDKFVFECVDICWLMAAKAPPMLLDFTCKKGSKFNKDTFSVYTKTGMKVDFLVWPPVYLYESGQLLQKGIVQLL